MEKNTTVIKSVYMVAGNDFQQRIPDPSIAGIDATVNALFQPANRPWLNQFMDILINRIAYSWVHNRSFTNPLGIFRKPNLTYGTSITETALKFIQAHSYRDDWGDRAEDIENLLKVHRPDGSTAIHTVNREDTYPISINYTELRGAFESETGLNELVAAIMQLPYNSEQYDEFQIYKELLSFYEEHHGFYKHQLSAVPTDEATGKEFLTAVRSYAGKLRFPTSLYNAQSVDIPVWVNPDESDELLLILTPDTQASLDVNTLASVFNVDLAEIKYRTIITDTIPIPNAVALLTTSDFFVSAIYAYENTSFFNPQTLTTNYYLHVIGAYSVSPFVPAILFTTDEGTVVPTVTQTVTGIELTAAEQTVEQGGEVQLTVNLTGSLAADPEGTSTAGIKVAPDAARYTVTALADGAAVPCDPYTYVDRLGMLHVADDMPIGAVITVVADASYVNPSGETPSGLTASVTVTVAERTDTPTDPKGDVHTRRSKKAAANQG